jgi:outer membrane protein assembly factor BamB
MPVRELPDSPWFAAAAPRVASGPSPAVAAALLPAPLATPSSLAPLWSFRFAANPYEPTPTRRNNGGFVSIDGGSENVIKVSPPATKYGVGTQLRFLTGADGGQRAVFLENFQLRIADAFTGILLQEGDGESVPPRPQEMRPRPRIPVYDFALQTPVEDERRWYAVLGYNRIVQSIDPLRINRIVAYDKASGQRVWSTDDWSEGEDGLVQVTALSAPTVFGEQLLLPVLHKGRYALQALDRSTGQPLWRTPIHSGGSIWFKAPGAQVQVLGSVAYVLTNAGAVAAIDAFAGTLRWIRKYERHDPLRVRPRGRRAKRDGAAMFMVSTFQEQDLPGALPSALFLVDGSVVVAPCDSDLLLCLDGASGEVVWMVDGTSRYAPYGSLRHLIGRDAERLYFEASDDLRDHVVSVAAATGIVEWSAEIPRTVDRTSRWPGRGAVIGDWVLLPGDRCVHALPLAGPRAWSRLDLPTFGVGDPPLTGPNNLHVDGAWLAVCYAQGVEVYSSEAALLQLAGSAASVREQALFLAQAGRVDEAFAAACAALERAGDPGAATPVLADQERGQLLLAAIDYARESADAMAALDRLSPFVSANEAQLAWRLARMDACRASGDARGLEQEQGALYRYMEGKQ